MLPKITSAMLIVTHACNLACRYCFVHQEPSRMTYDTAKRAAQFLLDNAEGTNDIPSINFFGGEPLLMWDSIIKPLTLRLREEVKKPFELSMTSNGILLDDKKIDFMKQHGIGLLFSLDGAKATQDYNRPFHDGRGSFDTLEPKILKILEAWPGMTLRMTAIPPTCEHVFENIQWGESVGYKNFFVIPNVFEEWDEEARAALAGEVRKYGDYYIDCCREGKRPMRFETFENCWKDIRAINLAEEKGEYRAMASCKACGKCGLGASRFASIHPNGNIYGCQEMTSNEGEESIFYIGNLDTGVDDARRKALMLEYDRKGVAGENCAECLYDRICDGGCVANNYLATGSLNEMPSMYCQWRQIILAEAMRVMQVLGGEKNEAFKRIWEGKA